jgi:formylglycine-generating enzyme required for sulfatase activity
MGFPDRESDDAGKACRRELGEEVASWLCFRNDELILFKDATPARDVFVSAFELDRFEVTVARYRACAAAGGCDVGALLSSDDRFIADAWPMVNVTWQDAVDYCAWVGKRLPTEAEWEKAARGGDGRRWPWGNQSRADGANHGRLEVDAMTRTHNYVTNGGKTTGWNYVADASDGAEFAAPPGQLVWGESPYGAFDMAGNVAEWVADYYWDGEVGGVIEGGYSDLGDVDPLRISPRVAGDYRVVRGGSWVEPALLSRVYARTRSEAETRSFSRGFRCARDVTP